MSSIFAEYSLPHNIICKNGDCSKSLVLKAVHNFVLFAILKNRYGCHPIETIDNGDCFYDAFAHGLKDLSINFNDHEEAVKYVRRRISEHISNNKTLQVQLNRKIENTAGISNLQDYINMVKMSYHEKQDRNDDSWGRPDVEGVILSDLFEVDLEVFEFHAENLSTQIGKAISYIKTNAVVGDIFRLILDYRPDKEQYTLRLLLNNKVKDYDINEYEINLFSILNKRYTTKISILNDGRGHFYALDKCFLEKRNDEFTEEHIYTFTDNIHRASASSGLDRRLKSIGRVSVFDPVRGDYIYKDPRAAVRTVAKIVVPSQTVRSLRRTSSRPWLRQTFRTRHVPEKQRNALRTRHVPANRISGVYRADKMTSNPYQFQKSQRIVFLFSDLHINYKDNECSDKKDNEDFTEVLENLIDQVSDDEVVDFYIELDIAGKTMLKNPEPTDFVGSYYLETQQSTGIKDTMIYKVWEHFKSCANAQKHGCVSKWPKLRYHYADFRIDNRNKYDQTTDFYVNYSHPRFPNRKLKGSIFDKFALQCTVIIDKINIEIKSSEVLFQQLEEIKTLRDELEKSLTIFIRKYPTTNEYFRGFFKVPRIEKQFECIQDKSIEEDLKNFITGYPKYKERYENIKRLCAESSVFPVKELMTISPANKQKVLIQIVLIQIAKEFDNLRGWLISFGTSVMDVYLLARTLRKFDSSNLDRVDEGADRTEVVYSNGDVTPMEGIEYSNRDDEGADRMDIDRQCIGTEIQNNIIIYAGSDHIDTYRDFFKTLGYSVETTTNSFNNDLDAWKKNNKIEDVPLCAITPHEDFLTWKSTPEVDH